MRQREIEMPMAGCQRPARQVVISSNNPHRLEALLRRERARKSIVIDSDIRRVRPGLWAVQVTQLRPIRPRWVRPVVMGGAAVSMLTALAALGSLLVGVVSEVSAAAVLGVLTVFAVLSITLRKKAPAGGGEVQVDVSVRVRR